MLSDPGTRIRTASTMAPSKVGHSPELHLASWPTLNAIATFTTVAYLLYSIITAVRVVYFSPLSHIPGPKLWIAFPILRWISNIRGHLDRDIRHLHEVYGEVVRYAPREVSFITDQAWQDVYGFKKMGHPQNPKPPNRREAGRPPSLINANDADHSRMRRALAHGFSDKALREQEPILQTYVNLLVDRLKDVAMEGKPADMVKWSVFLSVRSPWLTSRQVQLYNL